MDEFDFGNSIRMTFYEAVHGSLKPMGLDHEAVETYLTDLLIEFLRQDRLFAIRNAEGRPVESVLDLIAEGDIQLKATSFARERQVHKHIGDMILFLSGMFPGQLQRLSPTDRILNLNEQARSSYQIAASFDHPPYDAEAPILHLLSDHFEGYREGLSQVRASFFRAA